MSKKGYVIRIGKIKKSYLRQYDDGLLGYSGVIERAKIFTNKTKAEKALRHNEEIIIPVDINITEVDKP